MYFMLLILVTMGLVSTAACFSIIGIASMFAYNYVPALIMGAMLESGKIVVAVYLYRYWSMVTPLFKSILIMFLTVLMFITSVGIFGYLSQGYQKTSEQFKTISLDLKNLEDEYKVKKVREQEINRQVDQLPGDFVIGKIRLSREFGDEQAEIRDRLTIIEPRIQELRVQRLAYEMNIGPISYVARMLDIAQDTLVFYAILLLVFVADPLAVTLTVACNMALIRSWDRRTHSRTLSQEHGSGMLSSFVERMRLVALKSYGATFDKIEHITFKKPTLRRKVKTKPKQRARSSR